jgi:hypothetical protein
LALFASGRGEVFFFPINAELQRGGTAVLAGADWAIFGE